MCQFRLAQLLLKAGGRSEADYLHAIAWLQLAAEAALPPAQKALNAEWPKLMTEQQELVTNLRSRLLPEMPADTPQ